MQIALKRLVYIMSGAGNSERDNTIQAIGRRPEVLIFVAFVPPSDIS